MRGGGGDDSWRCSNSWADFYLELLQMGGNVLDPPMVTLPVGFDLHLKWWDSVNNVPFLWDTRLFVRRDKSWLFI